MTAQELVSALSEVIYLALFVVAAIRFARARSWASFDTLLFFGVIAVLLLSGNVGRLLGISDAPILGVVAWIGVTALAYVLLRLVDDFRPQPSWLTVAAGLAFAAIAVIGIVVPQPRPVPLTLLPVAYGAGLGGYASLAFLAEARRSQGVTRRRMQAVATGSGLLAAVILLAGVSLVVPALQPVLSVINQVLGVAIVLAYFVGFAPPRLLRRAWQEPALRAMLAEAPELVQLPDAFVIARRLAERAATITGAEGAGVGIWDERAGVLEFRQASGEVLAMPPGEYIAGRAFERQRPMLSTRAERDAPEHADHYRARGIQAIVAAPISSAERRLGVLAVYAARPPVFTEDVLALVTLLAEQAALVLRSHQLLREAAQVQALGEMTRLKDDFLSVVAHDVRTPLTTILINAELLEREMRADDRNRRRASSLREEALRLKRLVEDYLDVVSAEHGRELRREEADLVALTRDAIARLPQSAARVNVTGDAEVNGSFDPSRIEQLVANLVGNALKYSPPDQPVSVHVWADGERAKLAVTDCGIGIPEDDRPLLFARFHRGSNADDRQYQGMGLGLYICRQVAEEHGGSIEVSSQVGAGSTFTVTLERSARPAAAS